MKRLQLAVKIGKINKKLEETSKCDVIFSSCTFKPLLTNSFMNKCLLF